MSKLLRIFALLLLGVTTLTGRAQGEHYEGNLFLGAKGGVTLSQTFFNPSVPQGMKMGAMAGLMLRYIEQEHFGLIAELNFEQRGWKESFDETSYAYSRTLNYIQIPVLAHIYFGSPRAHFFINAGPEVGFMIGDSMSCNFDMANYKDLPDFPKNRQVAQWTLAADKKIDFGISAGLGAEVFLDKKRGSVTLEGRFYYGLGNVVETGRTQTFSSANSMSIMASIGYWFQLK